MQSSAEDYPSRDPQLFYELARDRLAAQLDAIDAMDNKIGLFVSLSSALMAGLGAVFALRTHHFHNPELATLSASALAYACTSVYGIWAYRATEWDFGPKLKDVWDRLWGDDDDDLAKWKTANDFWAYYKRNQKAQRVKEKALPLVLIGVVIQSFCLVLALSLVAAGV